MRRLLPLLLLAAAWGAEPAIDQAADVSLAEDGSLAVTLSGIAGSTLTARSSGPALLPDPTVERSGSTALLLLRPSPDANGVAVVTVTAGEGAATAAMSFRASVRPVNDPPTMTVPALVEVDEGTAELTVVLTGLSPGPADEAGQQLELVAHQINDAYTVMVLGIDHAPGATTASLRLRLPFTNSSGDALLLVNAFDDGGSADGGSEVAARQLTIRVRPDDDPPSLDLLFPIAVAPGGSRAYGRLDLRVNDDLTPAGGLVLTVATPPANGDLLLSGVALRAGGSFTQADIDNARLTYRHRAGAPGHDQWAFTYTDRPDRTPLGPVVAAVKAGGPYPPWVRGGGTATWREGDAPVAFYPGQVLDDDSPSLGGGGVTVACTAGVQAGDELAPVHQGLGAGEFGLDGAILLWGGRPFGSWSGGRGGTPLVAAFEGALASPDAASALLRSLRFRNTARDPGPARRVFSATASDGGGNTSLPCVSTVEVVPVDDPPLVTSGALAVPLGVPCTLALGASDPDSPTLTWAITGTPDLAAVVLADAALGTLRITGLRAGRGTLAVTVADGVNPPVAAAIDLVVSGGDDERPQAAGEVPGEAAVGEPWSAELPLANAAGALAFLAAGDCPPGLAVESASSDRLRLRWTPAAGEAGWRRFTIIAIDPARPAASAIPVLIRVRAAPGGSG
ncbi:MAG: hypothetical protein L6R48_23050 [Planctomycetes bacterium]|nr:hypothetical protein [Planctomycetota bacterium]